MSPHHASPAFVTVTTASRMRRGVDRSLRAVVQRGPLVLACVAIAWWIAGTVAATWFAPDVWLDVRLPVLVVLTLPAALAIAGLAHLGSFAWAWAQRRRSEQRLCRGLCPHCAYPAPLAGEHDERGTLAPGGACPECGLAPCQGVQALTTHPVRRSRGANRWMATALACSVVGTLLGVATMRWHDRSFVALVASSPTAGLGVVQQDRPWPWRAQRITFEAGEFWTR